MNERKYSLTLMDTDPNAGGGQPAAQPAGNNSTQLSYSFAQAEEIANARADRAVKASLAGYFKSLGMSEEQVTEAINDYKAKQAAQAPNVDKITKERDEAVAKVTDMERALKLREKGVRDADADYVMFKVRGMLEKDSKLDFDKAVDAFLKDNPRFTKAGGGYRVGTCDTDKIGKDDDKDDSVDVMAALRSALGHK